MIDIDNKESTSTSVPSSGYSSTPSISSASSISLVKNGKKKRKPVHVAKGLSGKEIRSRLKISKRDAIIARRIVNNIRHK